MQKFIFVDNKQAMADAWKEKFEGIDNVEAHGQVDIMAFKGDAVVSPANSFGFMDGGIDLIYTLNMGRQVQIGLQRIIREKYDGELLVGQSIVISTGYDRYPNMIVCPTMRVPSRLVGTQNVYLAAKALFLAAKRNPHLETIVCPGLGTGTGGVTPEECARVMRLAYDDWYLDEAKDNRLLKPETLADVFIHGNKQTTPEVKQPKIKDASSKDFKLPSRYTEGE